MPVLHQPSPAVQGLRITAVPAMVSTVETTRLAVIRVPLSALRRLLGSVAWSGLSVPGDEHVEPTASGPKVYHRVTQGLRSRESREAASNTSTSPVGA